MSEKHHVQPVTKRHLFHKFMMAFPKLEESKWRTRKETSETSFFLAWGHFEFELMG